MYEYLIAYTLCWTHTYTHIYQGREAASLLQKAVELISASTAKSAQHGAKCAQHGANSHNMEKEQIASHHMDTALSFH